MRDRGTASLGVGVLLLLALFGSALAAPWIAPFRPETQDLAHRLEGPDTRHPLGRDDLGRDLLSRAIWGARVSLLTGILVVAVSAVIGTSLGSIAAYAGGGVDASLMAAVDLLLGFPGALLAIALVAVLGARLGTLILSLSLIGWVAYARLARTLVLRLKTTPFVEAGRSLGSRPTRLLVRHLLPHVMGPVLVQASLGLGGVMLAESGLSFLGLGVPPPAPSWGGMLRSGSQTLLDAPRLAIVPGAALFLAVLAANLLGEGLRAWLDPSRVEPSGPIQ